MKPQKLENRVVVITGGGRGIGAETAKSFAKRGCRVAVLSRTLSEISEVSKEIERSGGISLAIKCDVSSESDVKKAFTKVRSSLGSVGILINNAAMVDKTPIQEMTLKIWDQVFAVNVRGSLLCAREAMGQMIDAKKGGVIIQISSLGGLRGYEKFENFSAYSSSKSAVVGFSECLAVEGKPYGIRSLCVAPGAVETKMLREAAPFLKTKTKPQDIAKVIVSLADDEISMALQSGVIEIPSNL